MGSDRGSSRRQHRAAEASARAASASVDLSDLDVRVTELIGMRSRRGTLAGPPGSLVAPAAGETSVVVLA